MIKQHLLDLNYFDYTILLIITYSVVMGFYKGLVKACTSFLTMTIPFLGAFVIYNPLKSLISKIVNNQIGSICITLIASYLVFLILISLINAKILNLTSNIRDGIVDRSFGFTFGFIRGIVISCTILQIIILASPLFLSASSDPASDSKNIILPEFAKQAKTYQLLNYGRILLLSFIPHDLALKNFNILSDKINHKKSDEKTTNITIPNANEDNLNIDDVMKSLNIDKFNLNDSNPNDNNFDINNDSRNKNQKYDNIEIEDLIKKIMKDSAIPGRL